MIDKAKDNVHFQNCSALNYFDSAIDNDILSVHYQMGGGCKNLGGSVVNFICKLNIFMLANSSMKD